MADQKPLEVKTTTFKNNRTQSVRFPKAVEFPEDVKEVSIVSDGMKRIVIPYPYSWQAFFESSDIPDKDRETFFQTLVHNSGLEQ